MVTKSLEYGFITNYRRKEIIWLRVLDATSYKMLL